MTPYSPSTRAPVRLHRNGVRNRSETLSAFNRNCWPHSSESAYNTVRRIFLQLLDRTNLRGAHSGRDPRIHDLRHTFAVRSLEQCRHDHAAVSRHLVALSTYLGHAHVTDTYWYLQATPVLMGQIAEASEALLQGGAT